MSRHSIPPAAAAMPPSGAPLFRTIESYNPRPAALLNGAVIAVVVLLAIAFVATHGGGQGRFLLVGTRHTGPRVLGLDRTSFTGGLSTQINFGPEPDDPWREIASLYFKQIHVLAILDANQDLAISPWEIFTAPAALRRLDADHDGRLSPEECGFDVGPRAEAVPPAALARARVDFMRANPILAALDADHDGEISAAEMLHSAVSLRSLDRNGDGSLTPDELIPDDVSKQTAIIFSRLDTNYDGVISAAERAGAEAVGVRELLDSADRNRDGIVTMNELSNELRLRQERTRQLESAKRAVRATQYHQRLPNASE